MNRKPQSHRYGVALLSLLLGSTATAQAPPLTLPQPSQKASISQTVGLTQITITFSRPAVKGRTIWGALVPFGEVWRAGANENTTISFSSPVRVGGTELPAGTYGLHAIPTERDWTLILSRVNTGWGSYGYDPAEDALRLTVSPQPSPHEEFLSYSFDDPGDRAVTVALRWEKLRVPFTVEVDTPAVVIASLERELRGLPQFFWQPWNQAATYCLQNKVATDRALAWIDRSIAINENFTNLATKSRLVAALGDTAAAVALMEKARPMATEAELNQYGYLLLGEGKVADAIAIFTLNTERHPESWNVWDSLGEGYDRSGNRAEAIKHYTRALGMAPDNQKARIDGILARLRRN